MKLSDLRKEPHLSASAINDYIECGLSYRFGRLDKLPIEGKADSLEYGSTIHKVLKEYYLEKMSGQSMNLKQIHKRFEIHWKKAAYGKPNVQYAKGNSYDKILLDGKALLSAWYKGLPSDNYRILAVEHVFSFRVPEIDIPIIGAMDLVEEDNTGPLIITDHKTTGRAYSADQIDKNQQLTIYQMALKANGYHDRDILLKFDVLIKTKIPRFEQYWTTRTEIDELRVLKKIRSVYDGIRKQVFVANDLSWKCKTCAYRKACDEWFLRRDT